jgi:hypothetical protein
MALFGHRVRVSLCPLIRMTLKSPGSASISEIDLNGGRPTLEIATSRIGIKSSAIRVYGDG